MKPRRERPFVELQPNELAGLRSGAPASFLGRFDAAALRGELARAGLADALAQRGYPDVLLRTDVVAGEQRLRVVARGGRVSLVDLRLAEGSRLADEPLLRRRGLEILSFLAIHWLALQDPRGRFSRERPRLPGQRYPGLGLGRLLYALVLDWAQAWGKDAVLNLPEYFHNAVFYGSARPGTAAASAPLFRFLSPARQGRFEALRRDLADLPIAAASAALDKRRVRERATGRVVRWEAGEMVVPLTPGLRDYLESPEYRQASDAARDAVSFRAS